MFCFLVKCRECTKEVVINTEIWKSEPHDYTYLCDRCRQRDPFVDRSKLEIEIDNMSECGLWVWIADETGEACSYHICYDAAVKFRIYVLMLDDEIVAEKNLQATRALHHLIAVAYNYLSHVEKEHAKKHCAEVFKTRKFKKCLECGKPFSRYIEDFTNGAAWECDNCGIFVEIMCKYTKLEYCKLGGSENDN